MKKIELGKSGVFVSAQGLGCMGMSEFYGETDREKATDVICHAVKSGVNFLDTADAYAYGDNERLIGDAIRQLDERSNIVLATKCGIIRDRSDPQKRGIDNGPEYIKRCCDESIERLGMNIDLFYLHRVVHDRSVLKMAMSAMAGLLNEGKIRAVGLSEIDADHLRFAHECLLEATGGQHGVSAVQTEYSLLSRGVENNGVLAACSDLDITFIAYSPICRGLLSGELSTLEHLADDDFRRTLPRFNDENLTHNNTLTNAIAQFSKSKGCTPAQLALAWLMHSGAKVIPIPGTKQLSYLNQNIASAEITLTPEEYDTLSGICRSFKAKGERYSAQAMKSYSLHE